MATKHIAAVVIVLSTTIFHLAMGLTVEITPQKYTDASTGKVTIACVLDPLDGCGKKAPMVVGLGKDGETQLAFVQQPSTIDFYIDPAKKYHAQGHLDKDTYTGYLNVSVSSPDHSDSGRYTCVIFCRYDTGVSQEVQASENLSVEIVDLRKALENLQNQYTTLQSELTAKDSAIDARMDNIDARTENMSQEITDLTDKVSYSTYFSAALKTDVDVTADDTIVFDDVQANEGKAYDGSTGLFTAPRDGLYVFHVALMTSCNGCFASARIMKDNVTVASLSGWDKDFGDHTSTSYVGLLDKGATVKVESWETSKLYGGVKWKYSLFSGLLLRAD